MEDKERFENLLRTNVTRDGSNVEGLINKLEHSDFFTAPASTKYHSSCKGGLVKHSLNVYDNLRELVKLKGLDISEESITICGLLHDMSKLNFYEPTIRNKKVYSEEGSKHDSLGRFDWVAEQSYKVIDDNERFIYGNHECTSVYMIGFYIPLKLEEEVAILHHHGAMSWDSAQDDIGAVYNRYSLACLLHVADMMAAYIDERVHV